MLDLKKLSLSPTTWLHKELKSDDKTIRLYQTPQLIAKRERLHAGLSEEQLKERLEAAHEALAQLQAARIKTYSVIVEQAMGHGEYLKDANFMEFYQAVIKKAQEAYNSQFENSQDYLPNGAYIPMTALNCEAYLQTDMEIIEKELYG